MTGAAKFQYDERLSAHERDWTYRVRQYVDFDRIETLFQLGYVEDKVQVVKYISLSVVVWKIDDAQ